MKTFLTLCITIWLTGCAMMGGTSPETVTERLALLEINFQEAIKALTVHRSEGRLSQSQIDSVDRLIEDFTRSRSAAKAALGVGEALQADQRATAAAQALQALRDVLAELDRASRPPPAFKPPELIA